MPTSATGRADRTGSEEGFTLVELLIVLVLLGLMSAAVVLAFSETGGSLRDEAERFAARTRAAQERAILGARATSLRVTDVGYGFDQRVRGDWVPVQDRELADRRWAEGVSARPSTSGAARIIFDPTGLADPASVTLERGDDRLTVTIAPDGAVDVTA